MYLTVPYVYYHALTNHKGVVMSEHDSQAARQEFARRLQKAMINKGMNQTQLAKALQLRVPEERVERDTISRYIRALSFPSAAKQLALAQVLGTTVYDLVPSAARKVAVEEPRDLPRINLKDVGDGNVWINVSQAVPMEKALKILEILK